MITLSTNPATLMIEGRPELKVHSIYRSPMGPSRFTVAFDSRTGITPRESREFLPDGQAYYYGDLRIVSRLAFTLDKPIIATTRDGEVYQYDHVGTFTPADGSEPIIHLRRANRTGEGIRVYQSTGKVIPDGGQFGSALTFSNGPLVEVKRGFAYSEGDEGTKYGVNLTFTDGVVTKIERL